MAEENFLQKVAEDVDRKVTTLHKDLELLGETTAVSAGAYSLKEKIETKIDPKHAQLHKVEGEIAATVASVASTVAQHEKKEAKK